MEQLHPRFSIFQICISRRGLIMKRRCLNMAIYHFSVQVISRADGRSAIAAASYRSGENLYDERNHKTHRFRKRFVKPETYILAPSDAPNWVFDREKLWNQVEQVEKRVDAQLAREINVALPKELSKEQQTELVLSFVQDQFVDCGMVADVAIHRDDVNNPHFHVMFTMREIHSDGFAKRKNRAWNNRELLVEWRKQWAIYANRALEKAGFKERIDHRSYAEQGIDKIPTQHLGTASHALEEKARKAARVRGVEYRPVTRLGQLNQEIQAINEKTKRLESNVISLQEEIQKRKAELRAGVSQIGLWNKLSPQEKVAIQFVQRRMKDRATLPLAIECRKSLERFSVSIKKKEEKLKNSYETLQEAQQLFKAYQKSDSANRDQIRLELARKGFTVEEFRNEVMQEVQRLKAELERIPKQKTFLAEGMEKVDQAIGILERFTWEELEVVYGSQVDQLRHLTAEDAYLLLEEARSTGDTVPVDQVDNFLAKAKKTSTESYTLAQQWEKLQKDQRFLINWKRKLDRLENEAITRLKIDPKEAASQLKKIDDERKVIAERMKKLKTSMHVLEKAMRQEIQEQYPHEDLSQLRLDLVQKILKLNEVENRVIRLDEIIAFDPKKGNEEKYSLDGLELLNQLHRSVEDLLFDDQNKKNNIHQAIEQEKWRRIRRERSR
jgi:hypothetical protein